jgi:stage V sporulation protein R
MTKKKTKYLSTSSEWTMDLLHLYDQEISRIAKTFGLNTFPNQIEIIGAEQMLDAYASIGMPINYQHWSFGKKILQMEKNYRRGHMGLAYEIVINSNPCIAYLLEENSMAMQALVIAHACYGHNSFFKNNYLFKLWTTPDTIIDYLMFARAYITECEEKYGLEEVEELLDACHALMNYGVYRYSHPPKLSLNKEKERQKIREEYSRMQLNEIWSTIPKHEAPRDYEQRFPPEPQENILYFIEKNAPLLETWQREIIRIIRKIAQYFYPQRQTQVMNEGWASFWHYTLLNKLYDEGLVTDELMLEVLQSHTSVIFQPSFDSSYYSGINTYALGFGIYNDIRRICEHPTEEDKAWFPKLVNTDWVKALHFAMNNFKDESFILQYLSPKLIRELKLFVVGDNDQEPDLLISAIHDEGGYQKIREKLSEQYSLSHIEPNIQVYNVNRRGDRALTLQHLQHQRRPLSSDKEALVKYLQKLWGFRVNLESLDDKGTVIDETHYPV